MSQTPPYGPSEPGKPEDPYPQQPQYPQPTSQYPQQQGYQPYGQPAYPNPYASVPQQRTNTTRNVLLIVGLVIVLFCGGLVTLGVLAFNGIGDAIEDSFDSDYPGSENDPLVVEEGEAFEIRDYDYAAGWSFVPGGDTAYGEQIEGLEVTDNREDTDYSGPSLVFTFYDGNRALAQIDCYTTVDLRRGTSTTLDCSGSDPVPGEYERIEVYYDALYE